MPQMTVYIVDDDTSVRESTALLLSLKGLRTETHDSAEKSVRGSAGRRQGLLLLDQRMPGRSGLELQQELLRRGVQLPVIIMTAYGDVASTRQALKSGAIDFLEKPVEHGLLLEVIDAAMAEADGRARRASEIADYRARIGRLTEREREVMTLLAQGLYNRDIAERLDISPRTVEIHKARTMDKLGTRTLGELIRLVLAATVS